MAPPPSRLANIQERTPVPKARNFPVNGATASSPSGKKHPTTLLAATYPTGPLLRTMLIRWASVSIPRRLLYIPLPFTPPPSDSGQGFHEHVAHRHTTTPTPNQKKHLDSLASCAECCWLREWKLLNLYLHSARWLLQRERQRYANLISLARTRCSYMSSTSAWLYIFGSSRLNTAGFQTQTM